jgi:hypothetical protein
MNRTLLALAVMAAALGATVARADDCDTHFVRQGYGPQEQGQYQLQNRQVWVPGTQQQVWVPGSCNRYGCTEGGYQYVSTPGHYENRQEWVWVAYQFQPRHDRHGYGRVDFGLQQPRYGRSFHGATPVGYR